METDIDRDQDVETIILDHVRAQEILDQAQGTVQTGPMIDIGHIAQDNAFLSFYNKQSYLNGLEMSFTEIRSRQVDPSGFISVRGP